jgi:type IV pilus assembly protein PilO
MTLASLIQPLANQPRSTKIGLGVIVVVLILGGGFFLLISPAKLSVADLRAKHESLRAEVIQNEAIAANLAKFRAQALALRQRLDAIRERLPVDKEIPQLYRAVSNLAYQSGLSVLLFQPREPQPKEFYAEVPITVNAEVGYHQLGSFFERLARLPRIVGVGDLKLSAVNRPTGSVRADMTLVTYLFKDIAPPEPTPGGGRR